jgi:hypothetical protein
MGSVRLAMAMYSYPEALQTVLDQLGCHDLQEVRH